MRKKDSPPSPGLTARSLLRAATTACLGTISVRGGEPYCSLVMVATDPMGNPLLLMSDLAVHSHNIKGSAQASLLVNEAFVNVNPLTQARVTFQGTVGSTEDDQLMRRYLRRYPSSEAFASFADFKLYRFIIEEAHLVGGFGNIHWIDGTDIIMPSHFLDVEKSEIDILDHMNSDHSDAVQSLAFTETQINRSGDWEMVSLDPEGFDLRSGWNYQRILFENSVSNANDVRNEIIRLVKNARN
ncbi:MAG: DUF2470 domain-containing protein [Sneathiella sp.]